MPHNKFHHLHLPHFTFDNTHNLKMLYGLRVSRDLINKLAFFFLPLFLYQLGPKAQIFNLLNLNLNNLQKGIIFISLYFIFHRSANFITAILAGQLIVKRLGFKYAFMISSFCYILIFLLLKQSLFLPELMILAAIIDGTETNFFWPVFHDIYSQNIKFKKVGEDLGLLQFLLQLVAMISPAIGGLIAVFLGFDNLFLIAVLLTLLGVAFIVNMHQQQIKHVPSFKEFFAWLKEKQFQRLSLAYMGKYFNDATLAIWPLYLFILLDSVDKVGFLYSLSLFLAMIISFFAGFYIDHKKSKKPFFAAGGLLSFLWLLRGFIVNIWSIVVVDTAEKLVNAFHALFYESIWLKRGKGKTAYAFYLYREMIISISAIIFWLCLDLIFIIWGNWQLIFILAAVGVMLSLLIKERVKIE